MFHCLFRVVNVEVYLIQPSFFFFVSMGCVLKDAQLHLCFDALQTVMNGRCTHRSIGVIV